MPEKREFLRVYLILALVIGIVAFADNILRLFKLTPKIYVAITSVLFFLFFIISIIAIPLFVHHHAGGVVYILPIYYLVVYLFFSLLGLVLSFLPVLASRAELILTIAGFLTAIFQIVFAVYVLEKVKPTASASNLRTSGLA